MQKSRYEFLKNKLDVILNVADKVTIKRKKGSSAAPKGLQWSVHYRNRMLYTWKEGFRRGP